MQGGHFKYVYFYVYHCNLLLDYYYCNYQIVIAVDTDDIDIDFFYLGNLERKEQKNNSSLISHCDTNSVTIFW